MSIAELQQSKEYFSQLRKIRQKCPTAIIAGGAIRDAYHDRVIKDIDIYIIVDEIKNFTYSCFKEFFGGHVVSMHAFDGISEDDMDEEYFEVECIEETFVIVKNNIEYNFIIIDQDPIVYVNEYFDIGLCKTYFDGTKITLTPEFMTDSRNKTLTVVVKKKSKSEFDSMLNYHVARLQQKYPDFKLIIPEKNRII